MTPVASKASRGNIRELCRSQLESLIKCFFLGLKPRGSELVGLEEVRDETSASISSDVQPGLGNTELSIWAAVSRKGFLFFKILKIEI